MEKQSIIILTGTQERNELFINEFRESYNDFPIRSLPLIQIELKLGDHLNRLQKLVSDHEASSLIISVFSINGVESLKNNMVSSSEKDLGKKIMQADWAVVADRSAESVEKNFPGAKIVYRSGNSTGAGLAESIMESPFSKNKLVLAFSAERGREEFYEILEKNDYLVERFSLYKTIELTPSIEELNAISGNAVVVFGSPSSVRAFFKNKDVGRKSFRYAVIGPTTAKELLAHGQSVYLQSKKTDYRSLIRELIESVPGK